MRVAIVNDMRMAVEALRRSLVSRPDWEIAWIAVNGAEAVEHCCQDRPDVVLMDLIMPVMDGVEATRRIMKEAPCAILVVTATVDGNISRVFDAMGAGALDAVNTPVLGAQGELAGAQALLAKLETIARLLGRLPSSASGAAEGDVRAKRMPIAEALVVIGASTGGPSALFEILSRFPDGFRPAVVIVQHVDVQFAPQMADWLSHRSPLPVGLATPGCRPEAGRVWLAGTNDHLVMNPDRTLSYQSEPARCFYRPSVDVFFKSVAAHWLKSGVAVILTGMGRDGAEGLLALRQGGWHTLVQDEKTSVVFGMPKAAIEIGAAQTVLPVADLAAAIVEQVGVAGK